MILGFDLLAAAGEATLGAGDPTRTILIGSISETPTGSMITPERSYPELDELRDRVAMSTMVDQNRYVDAAA